MSLATYRDPTHAQPRAQDLIRHVMLLYSPAMSTKLDILETSTSWATPTDDDIRAWEALPRDQQLARMRALFDSAECNRLSHRPFAEIIAAARSKAISNCDG